MGILMIADIARLSPLYENKIFTADWRYWLKCLDQPTMLISVL